MGYAVDEIVARLLKTPASEEAGYSKSQQGSELL
jgi:hypothetical protein